jgi:heme-degrading monooxygenase HmoA
MSIRKAMNRRNYLKALAAALPAATIAKGAATAAAPPIQLHCDLQLDPAKEKVMLDNYRKIFRPTISKQPGFVAVTLLKLRAENQGKAPAGCPYRLIISFTSEEARLKWVASAEHKKAWPTVEDQLVGPKFNALLYDPVV